MELPSLKPLPSYNDGQTVTKTDTRSREDGRKALLVYLDPDLILQLKRQALDDGSHVYLVVERLLREGVKKAAEG